MDEFWKSAVKYCGSAALAGLLGYTVYPQIISSPYLINLTHTELFALMCLLVIVTFALSVALINSTKGRSGSNTVTIKGSTVHSSVRAGNDTNHSSR